MLAAFTATWAAGSAFSILALGRYVNGCWFGTPDEEAENDEG